jgi:hypothetical protein
MPASQKAQKGSKIGLGYANMNQDGLRWPRTPQDAYSMGPINAKKKPKQTHIKGKIFLTIFGRFSSILEPFWTTSWNRFGASWDHLALSCDHLGTILESYLGTSLEHLGHFWTILGWSCDNLWATFAPLWNILGASWEDLKSHLDQDPKHIPKMLRKLDSWDSVLGSQIGPHMEPFW